MDVSENSGTPKSSILIGFSIIFTIHFGVPLFLEIPKWSGPCWLPSAATTEGKELSYKMILLVERIRRTPVEVGSLSHYLQGPLHPNGVCPWDFWTMNQQYP